MRISDWSSDVCSSDLAWDMTTCMRLLPQMDDAGIAMVEQPLPFWNKDGMAALCSRLRMAVVADEGLWDLHDAYAAFKSGATALYGVKIGKGDRKSTRLNSSH